MIVSFLRTLVVILTFSICASSQTDYTVKFKTGEYLPESNISEIDEQLKHNNEDIIEGRFYKFIQFNDALNTREINAINDLGIKLLTYVPNYTYLASIPMTINSQNLNALNARSIWDINNEMKIHSDIVDRSLPNWAIENDRALLTISYYKDLEFLVVANMLKANNIDILRSNGYNNYISISVALDDLSILADIPCISYVEPISAPPVKDDRRGRSLHRVNRLNPAYENMRNYSGAGINVLVRDDGEVYNHPDFNARINQEFVGHNRGSHGDGVAGIMSGAGNLDPVNRGMAHGSFMYVSDYDASFQDETMSLFNNRDVIVTNSSYSNGCNAGYTLTTETVDQQVYDNPTLLHVFSVGNNGAGRLNDDDELVECGYGAGLVWGNITGGHKIGKNVIATANLNYKGEIMESSSRGPSADGRIKPDIAANGNNHVSTAEGNEYISFGGTSGAAPVIAGVTAMLHEAHETLFGERANSALLKAIMLNTANDLGNIGPDYIYGWGSLNGHRSALTLEENRFINGQINQDQSVEHIINVPENVAELRIMTYWPDVEANQFSTITLLNDINSTVIDPANDEHLPWFLDPSPNASILSSPAVKGQDFLNNVEQVAIDNPSSGQYKLNLEGAQIPFGVNEYYVVWEFRMNEIDIIFPNGGENLNENTTEVIHWDATGTEGEFKIEYISGDDVNLINTLPGTRRYFEWKTPNYVDENAKIRITRGDISDESTESFLIANNPRNINISDPDSFPVLQWSGVDEAISYNIFALDGAYMEKVETIEADSFIIPDTDIFRLNWLSVSANFEEGSEGKRGFATANVPPPVALATNDQENKPCVNRPVLFESQSTDTLLIYDWNFGTNSIPEEADTKGPHNVLYTVKGNSLAALTVRNNGGEDQTFFIMNVIDKPEDGETTIEDLGEGEYEFDTKIKSADTYMWDFGDGNQAEGKTVNHAYTQSGEFEVIVIAQNKCGSIQYSESIFVDLTNAVHDLTIEDFSISPNPNDGNFSIELPDLEGNDLILSLLSIDGKVIERRDISNPKIGQAESWKDLHNGIYLLKFQIGNHEITERIIVN